jgi:sigma-B regulation protein RsbU (phosphoserine phosphatase)
MPTGTSAEVCALSISADPFEFRRASAWLEESCRERAVPAAHIVRLDLCLNEALANVLKHGGAGVGQSGIGIGLKMSRSGGTHTARLTVTDAGTRFNPLDHVTRSRPASLEEAEPGGLGIAMMRIHSDALDYQYRDGRNQLEFSVSWQAAAADPVPGPATFQMQPFRRGLDRRLKDDETNGPAAGETAPRRVERRTLGIRWIPLFRGVDEGAVHQALDDAEVVLLPAGSALLKPGEHNQSVFILLSGDVAASLDSSLSPDAAISIAPGQCIGELSAIDGKAASALVRAQTDARLLKLSKDVFWNRLMALPGVAGNLMITLTERMRSTNELALRAQREKLELIHLRKELDVARQLQISMVPLQRPMFPARQDIEVCGFMEPASSVGGDLFDAFFISPRRLFFCIGDVAGHGVASALFMACIIGLMRVLAMSTGEPDRLLAELNDRLCIGNDTSIFVTLFCGMLDTDTGELIYSNGGHCPPLLRKGGASAPLPLPRGPLIGAFEGMNFLNLSLTLEPGDTLFCYTDGVTEARTPAGEEFSDERCLPLFDTLGNLPLPEMLDALRREIGRFTGTAMLDDDCTMLALRRPARQVSSADASGTPGARA